MTITPEQIAEWRAEQGNGLTSAVGEYTPAEFWQLLDAYEALAKQAAEYEEALDMKEEKYGMPWRFWADKARELAGKNIEKDPVAWISVCKEGEYAGEVEAVTKKPDKPPFNKSWGDWFPVYGATS